MKNLLMITATSVLLATSASAGSLTFSLPNLWFPPSGDVTVSKDCLSGAASTDQCDTQE